MNVYDIGDAPIRLSFVTLDANSVPADAVSISLKVTDPSGVTTTYTPTRDGTGTYHQDVSVPVAAASAGRWRYRLEVTGAGNNSADEQVFYINPSPFYP